MIMVLVVVTGCSENTLEDYKEALIKTENIEQGKSEIRVDLNMTFETEGLDEETIRELKTFENIVFEGKTSFDMKEESRKVVSKNFISLGGLGIHVDYHQDGDRVALYIPMVGKFIDLNMSDMENMSPENEKLGELTQVDLSDETLRSLDVLWRETFEADDVIKGEKSTMETPEGDVRVVKFTVTPDEMQIKDFVFDAVNILINDESVKELTSLMREKSVDGETALIDVEILDDFETQLNEFMQSWTVKSFEVVDFIDVDGYIIQSNTNLEIETTSLNAGAMKSMVLTITSDIYEIEKGQNIEFPELTDDNSISIDGLQQGLPSTYENLIN